ncbi:MAG: AsnC family transcriptional regulator [Armatimonadota bacterium]
MDTIDRQLLNLLQTEFPLVPEPFNELGKRLKIGEGEVILRVQSLKDQGIIRQISAIFDSHALGYSSSLAAFSVPRERVEQVAEIVNAHPGVSHNYERDHAYNLWFTITVPPGTAPDAEVDRLAAQANPLAVRMFPTIRLFKIGVAFDMAGGKDGIDAAITQSTAVRQEPVELDEPDIAAVRALQRDLPVESRPFALLAARAGMKEDELIAKARMFLQLGAMRRYAAVLKHREAGYSSNAMAVWNVPKNMIEHIGPKLALHKAVSHCYERPTYPDWPYSVFTMIHGKSIEDCENAARELSNTTGITDYVLLYSGREFKKTRVLYYEQA